MKEKRIEISAAQILKKWDVDVYPVTLVKYLMNKRLVLSYFRTPLDPERSSKLMMFKRQPANECKHCLKNMKMGRDYCRTHLSVERIMDAKKVLVDLDTGAKLYKNEIFKQVGDKVVVIFCPHPKKIDITDKSIRKMSPMTIENLLLPEQEHVQFMSSDLMDDCIKFGINDNSIQLVTEPRDRHGMNWKIQPR